MGNWWASAILIAAAAISGPRASAETGSVQTRLVIPETILAPMHEMTNADLIALRDIDSLSVAPDGSVFSIFVRQARVQENDYKSAWFIGNTTSGLLTYAGDGGEAYLAVGPDGRIGGDLAAPLSQWSADGKWTAYLLKHDGQFQIWASRADTKAQRQVTYSDADVHEFKWSKDADTLYYTTGESRDEVRNEAESERRNGIYLNEFTQLGEVIFNAEPARPSGGAQRVWAISMNGGPAHVASEIQRQEFEIGVVDPDPIRLTRSDYDSSKIRPASGAGGSAAWFARENNSDDGMMPRVRLVATLPHSAKKPVICAASECAGSFFHRAWWSDDGTKVYFWRQEGDSYRSDSFYSWSPSTGKIREVLRPADDYYDSCEKIRADRLICLRAAPTRPRHVVALSLRTGEEKVLTDVNPEMKNIRFGTVERLEWKVPDDTAGVGYPKQAHGYILFPPNFDPRKKYPAIISPYRAGGFLRGDVGDEQPLQVYAANGFVVLNTEFPNPTWQTLDSEKKRNSSDLGFPQYKMFLESTLLGLDVALARGFIDERKVGMGGLSSASMNAMYTLQTHDRLAAVSVDWGGEALIEYYMFTRTGRQRVLSESGYEPFFMTLKPDGEDREKWRKISPADNVQKFKAPVLFHLADREVFLSAAVVRNMDDANKPYDAYIFPNEYHVKWQPAHRFAIYTRNLDWFRYWLQGYQDSASGKSTQYARWGRLRNELQSH